MRAWRVRRCRAARALRRAGLTYEKGADLVMHAAFWLLKHKPHVQIYIVGPIGDEVGQHVSTRLQLGAQVSSLRERLFVATTFFPVTSDMRYGTDFCLCPSRVEPFGYVDVEFAWHGTPTIGALVGGLGKVPGVYYRVQAQHERPTPPCTAPCALPTPPPRTAPASPPDAPAGAGARRPRAPAPRVQEGHLRRAAAQRVAARCRGRGGLTRVLPLRWMECRTRGAL
jgi:hypothetical protein